MSITGVAILGCAVGILIPDRKLVSMVTLIATAIAAASLAIGSIVITVAVTDGVDRINKLGEDISVNIIRGTSFLIISWIATGVMISATMFWGVRFRIQKREAKMPREKGEY